MDLTDRLRQFGGAARTRTLLECGISERGIARAVANGTVKRPRRGVLTLPDADPRMVATVSLAGRLTCMSALEHHEIALLNRSTKAHIAVPSAHTTARTSWRGVRLHYRKSAPRLDALGPPVVSVAQALDDSGRCLDELAHLVAVDSALHQGLVNAADIAAFTASSHARRDWLLAHADGRSEAVGETLARLSCVRHGLAVHPQRFLPGVGRVDLVVERRVVVEIDGFGHHSDPVSFRRDRRRSRHTVRHGMPVLRFAHAELMGPDAVEVGAEVRDWLGSVASARMAG